MVDEPETDLMLVAGDCRGRETWILGGSMVAGTLVMRVGCMVDGDRGKMPPGRCLGRQRMSSFSAGADIRSIEVSALARSSGAGRIRAELGAIVFSLLSSFWRFGCKNQNSSVGFEPLSLHDSCG